MMGIIAVDSDANDKLATCRLYVKPENWENCRCSLMPDFAAALWQTAKDVTGHPVLGIHIGTGRGDKLYPDQTEVWVDVFKEREKNFEHYSKARLEITRRLRKYVAEQERKDSEELACSAES